MPDFGVGKTCVANKIPTPYLRHSWGCFLSLHYNMIFLRLPHTLVFLRFFYDIFTSFVTHAFPTSFVYLRLPYALFSYTFLCHSYILSSLRVFYAIHLSLIYLCLCFFTFFLRHAHDYLLHQYSLYIRISYFFSEAILICYYCVSFHYIK